jgi:thiol-disulfide isomerase/thioredoxin
MLQQQQEINVVDTDLLQVVANFSASWCGPCRVISTVYAEMSQTYPQLMFLTVDVDELMVTDILRNLILPSHMQSVLAFVCSLLLRIYSAAMSSQVKQFPHLECRFSDPELN